MDRRRPEKDLAEVKLIRSGDSDTKVDKEGKTTAVDKRATSMSVVANAEENKSGDNGGFMSQELFTPSPEQLEKINQFTRKTVTKDDVVCFSTHSCNDVPDRDDDRFKTSAVKGFAELAAPYSPNGKSFMVSHDHSSLGIGRIFDTTTGSFKKTDPNTGGTKSHTALLNDVYIPKIAANETFIQNLEFGVNWAVSVGVQFGASSCTIGKEHDWGWYPWFCSQGHEKGLYYDASSDEEDDWGWPAPTSPDKGVLCVRDLDDAKDMYELSQVFLGAQYYAELSKDPAFSGIIKEASARSLPIIGLKNKERKGLRLPEIPEKMTSAAKNHKLSESGGRYSWTDEDKLAWSYTPGVDEEPLLLGKAAEGADRVVENDDAVKEIHAKFEKAKSDIADENFTQKDSDGVAAAVPALQALIDQLDAAITSQDMDEANSLIDQVNSKMDELYDALYDNDDPDVPDNTNPGKGAKPPTEKGNSMSKAAVLAAVQRRDVPKSVTDALADASDENVLDVLLGSFEKTIAEQKEMVTTGQAYLKELRADTLDWYRKAHADPRTNGGANVSQIEKLLNSIGDNVEGIRTLRDDYQDQAEKRFGKKTLRSSTTPDPNEYDGPEELKGHRSSDRFHDSANRLHG